LGERVRRKMRTESTSPERMEDEAESSTVYQRVRARLEKGEGIMVGRRGGKGEAAEEGRGGRPESARVTGENGLRTP
jgi:hypothetical protein